MVFGDQQHHALEAVGLGFYSLFDINTAPQMTAGKRLFLKCKEDLAATHKHLLVQALHGTKIVLMVPAMGHLDETLRDYTAAPIIHVKHFHLQTSAGCFNHATGYRPQNHYVLTFLPFE